MSFSIISAVGKNLEIGKGGDLIWHIPEDLKFFKKTTMGHKIIMGRKTFESLPGALPGRENIVVSRSSGVSLEDLDFPNEEVFVIGGGEIYRQMLPKASKLYLTEIDASDPDADTFFPEFDKSEFSREVLGSGEHDGVHYEFALYTRKTL